MWSHSWCLQMNPEQKISSTLVDTGILLRTEIILQTVETI